MPTFDPATFMLSMGVLGLLMAWIAFSLHRSLAPQIRGLNELGIAMVGVGVSFLLFYLRPYVHEFVGLVLANLFALSTPALFVVAATRLLEREVPWRFIAVIAAICSLALLYAFAFARSDDVLRAAAISLPTSVLFFRLAYEILATPWARRSPSAWLSASCAFFLGLTLALRVGQVLLGQGASAALFAKSPLQFAFLFIAFISTIAVSMGLILMVNERIRFANLAAVEEGTHQLRRANRDLLDEVERRRQLEIDIAGILEAEQRKLGRALHQEIAQKLSGIGFMLEHLRGGLAAAKEPDFAEIEKIQSFVAEAATQTRILSRDLSAGLSDEGIGAALYDLGGRLRRIDRIECFIECAPTLRLEDRDFERHLYQVASAAVTRAVAAKGITFLRLRLRVTDKKIRLLVSSDHARDAFDDGTESRDTIKLMSHRALLAGASLQVRSWPSGGSTVVLTKRPSQGPLA